MGRKPRGVGLPEVGKQTLDAEGCGTQPGKSKLKSLCRHEGPRTQAHQTIILVTSRAPSDVVQVCH